MFQDSLVESSGRLKSNSRRYMGVTAAFNVAVVAVGMLVPLLYPEALPRTAMTAMLSAPAPPPAPPSPQTASAKAAKATARLDADTAPAKIPRNIDMTHEDPPPPASGTGSVSMANAISGRDGLMDVVGLGAAPPIVKEAPRRAAGPERVSSGVMAGQILTRTQPLYPPIAKAAHMSGAVVLHAIISRTGAIQSLSVVSGPEMLRASAIAAVQGWRYRPYLLNNDPTEVETTITVNFSFAN